MKMYAVIIIILLLKEVAAGRDNPTDSEILIGMGLSTAAGMATCLGAAIVFSKTLSSYANGYVLAAALSLSSGVMIYVSFVEMFSEALHSFAEAGISESLSSLYTFLAFFGGMVSVVDACTKR